MSEDRIKADDLVDFEGTFKQIKKLNEQLTDAIKKAKELSKSSASAVGGGSGTSTDVRNSTEASQSIRALTEAKKKLLAQEKELLRLQRSVTTAVAREGQMNSDLNRELIRRRENISQTNRAIRQEVRLEGAASDSLAAMRVELSRLNREYDNGSAIVRNQHLPAIQQLRAEMERLESQTGRDQMRVGRYREAWGQTSQAFSAAKGKIMLVIGAVVAVGKAIQKTTQMIITYNTNLSKVSNSLKTNADNTADVTKEVKALAVAYDAEFNEVLKASSVLVNEFGISAEGALSLINEGFEKGANVNGEYLELLKEYPAQFKAAGLSAKQTIAFISQTENMGIFSDKGLDTIKEATIRLREMPKATRDALEAVGIDSTKMLNDLRSNQITYFDAIQSISAKMGTLNQKSTEFGTIIADVFGGAGEDAGAGFLMKLTDINIELDTINSGMSTLETSSIDLSKAWSKWSDNAISSGSVLSTILETIYSTATSFLETEDEFTRRYLKNSGALTKESEVLKQVEEEMKDTGRERLEIIEGMIDGNNLMNKQSSENIANAEMMRDLSKDELDRASETSRLNASEHAELQKKIDLNNEIIKEEKFSIIFNEHLLSIYNSQVASINQKKKAQKDADDEAKAAANELANIKNKNKATDVVSETKRASDAMDEYTESLLRNNDAKTASITGVELHANALSRAAALTAAAEAAEAAAAKARNARLADLSKNAQAVANSFGALSSMLQERQAINSGVLADYDANISTLEESYADEEDKRNLGIANNAEKKKSELRDLNVERDEEMKRQKTYTKTIQMLQEAQQISNMVTAVSNLFLTSSSLGPLGTAAAIIQIVAMIGSYATFKQQAKNLKDGEVMIDGPGTETSDSIAANLSKNESVIKAKSTKNNFGLLTGINDGSISEKDPSTIIKYLAKNHGFDFGGIQVKANHNGDLLSEMQKQTKLLGNNEQPMSDSEFNIIKNGNFTKRIRKLN